jgi:protein dithiol:quinone oxidoreductase
MTKIAVKFVYMSLSWLSLLVLAASFYLEYGLGLQPCPLCLMQRYMVVLIALTSFMASRWIALPKVRVVLGLQLFFSLAGMYFAGRQLWLQSLPTDKVPACMPSLDTLIHYFPWQDIARALFLGAGDCAEDSWTFAGVSLAGWCLLFFTVMFCVSAVLLYRQKGVTKAP